MHKNSNLFESLGIDWSGLLLQTLAFLILFVIIKRFLFPAILKSIEKRESQIKFIEDSVAKSKEADLKNKERAEKIIRDARKRAESIIQDSKNQSEDILNKASEHAENKVNLMIAKAQADMNSQFNSAKKELRKDIVNLVFEVSEKFLVEKIDKEEDKKIINQIVKDKLDKGNVV